MSGVSTANARNPRSPERTAPATCPTTSSSSPSGVGNLPRPTSSSRTSRIRAFYPVFGRVFDDPDAQSVPGRRPLGRLFREESRNSSVGSTSSSSAATDLDGVPADSYCVWTPGASPASSPGKSGSTGSLPRWRRVSLSQLGRSHSESRDKLRFLSAPPSPAREQPKGKPRGRNSKATTELDTVASSHRLFYGAKASPGAAWRAFLPYRQDLVGLFSTPKGLSRTQYHPF